MMGIELLNRQNDILILLLRMDIDLEHKSLHLLL